MKANYPRIFRLTIILALFSLTVVGQQRTREDMVKEAGKLLTDAERKQGEAYQKAGTDRKLIREAEKLTADALEKAIELWREAAHDQRLIAGVEELTRIYSVHGEYEKVVDRLTREAEYWKSRGNIAQHTISTRWEYASRR